MKGYILDVEKTQRGCTILLSRSHPGFLVKLFEIEVPEIQQGIIKVVGAAREPGERAKIAVYSQDPSIDPIGACVGVKGSRVQAVVQELKGEKIDIIPWSKDAAKFVCNALAPARVSKVYINEDEHSMEIIVHDDQLSLAIGKKGPEREARFPAHGLEDGHKERNGGREDVTQGHRRTDQPTAGQRDPRPHTLRRVSERHERYRAAHAEELNKITSISIEDCARIIENAKKAIIDIETEKTRAAEAQSVERERRGANCRRRERRGGQAGERGMRLKRRSRRRRPPRSASSRCREDGPASRIEGAFGKDVAGLMRRRTREV